MAARVAEQRHPTLARAGARAILALLGFMVAISVWGWLVVPADARVPFVLGAADEGAQPASVREFLVVAPLCAIVLAGLLVFAPLAGPSNETKDPPLTTTALALLAVLGLAAVSAAV